MAEEQFDRGGAFPRLGEELLAALDSAGEHSSDLTRII
jgi:hypothetical protein